MSNLETLLWTTAAASALAGLTWLVWRRKAIQSELKAPSHILDTGWQFYSKPTTLEPPGTVFRIDTDGRRYLVTLLDVPSQIGQEAAGRVHESVSTSTGVLARFLGLQLGHLKTEGRRQEQLVFEIKSPAREVTTDQDIEAALVTFLDTLDYRVDNRYFIVRECRTARAMSFTLSDLQLIDLGGQVMLKKLVSGRGTLVRSSRTKHWELNQQFPKPMRVMFLPEEIKPITAAFAGNPPQLGRVRVKETLNWKDPE